MSTMQAHQTLQATACPTTPNVEVDLQQLIGWTPVDDQLGGGLCRDERHELLQRVVSDVSSMSQLLQEHHIT